MWFENEDEAWEYWRGLYEYNGKYEGRGHSFDAQVDIFKDWLEDECIMWPDKEKE